MRCLQLPFQSLGTRAESLVVVGRRIRNGIRVDMAGGLDTPRGQAGEGPPKAWPTVQDSSCDLAITFPRGKLQKGKGERERGERAEAHLGRTLGQHRPLGPGCGVARWRKRRTRQNGRIAWPWLAIRGRGGDTGFHSTRQQSRPNRRVTLITACQHLSISASSISSISHYSTSHCLRHWVHCEKLVLTTPTLPWVGKAVLQAEGEEEDMKLAGGKYKVPT